ncbi:hypothetical protein E4U55_000372 [Claviceps digitariae]|nr:hypothetical protein E4U55_000372 [Claviceps digitariae]
MIPRLIFAGGGIGGSADSRINSWMTPEQTIQLLRLMKEAGSIEIDAGASYPHGTSWHSETLVGEAKADGNGFNLYAKIAMHVRGPQFIHERIAASLDRSRSLTGVDKFFLVYSHMEDAETPLAVTAAAFHEQHLAGKFNRLGLCNYSVEQLIEYFAICDANNYVKPSVIQANTRWHGDNKLVMYDKAFNKPIVYEAMRRFKVACDDANPAITTTEASLRWLLHHSQLREDDAIIVDATSIWQKVESIAWSKEGPLDEAVVSAVEAMWTAIGSAQTNAE